MHNSLIFSIFADGYNILNDMVKSDRDMEIETLKAELKREQEKNVRLEARNARLKNEHEADKREIKNLRRRKDPESKKKDRKRAPREIKVTEEQRRLLSSLLQGIDILS